LGFSLSHHFYVKQQYHQAVSVGIRVFFVCDVFTIQQHQAERVRDFLFSVVFFPMAAVSPSQFVKGFEIFYFQLYFSLWHQYHQASL
jgi:hypothetical protein